MRKNRLKQKLAAGQCVIGPNLQIPSPMLVQMIGLAGFDYIMLDGEHGFAYSELFNLIVAASDAGITPMVRVPSHDRGFLLPPLEAGAGGIMAPMVGTPEQARHLVQQTKYGPIGRRGFSNVTRAADYGAITQENLNVTLNPEVLLWVQLETKEGLDNAVDIVRTPGVDLAFIGPADLAQSLGLPGRWNAPEVIAAMRRLIRQIRPFVSIGTTAFSTEEVRFWTNEGVQVILTSSMHPIRQALQQLHATLAAGLQRRED